MSTSARQTIITALLTQLGTILVANGYNTGLGSNVKEWREYPTDFSDHPILIVRDLEDKVDCGYAVHSHELEVELEIIDSGSTVAADMRKMIADIYDCFGKDLSIGGYVQDIEYRGDAMKKLHEEQMIMGCIVTIVLKYETGPFDSDNFYHVGRK